MKITSGKIINCRNVNTRNDQWQFHGLNNFNYPALTQDQPYIKQDDSYCLFCRVKDICLSAQCEAIGIQSNLKQLVSRRQVIHQREQLFRQNQNASNLVVLSSGVCKSYFLDNKGREHVSGFFYPGDLIGIEALAHDHYHENSVMLETGCVCYIPKNRLKELLTDSPELQEQLITMLSRQFWQEHLGLANFTAEEGIIQFLLTLSEKQKRFGFSSTLLHIAMSRNDMANYLGLRSETVSRVLTRLSRKGLIRIRRNEIELREIELLKNLLGLIPLN